MAFLDINTLNVLTVLVIDMAGAIIIFLGFLYVRSLRGDRTIVRSSYTNKMVTEIVFEESQMNDSKDLESEDRVNPGSNLLTINRDGNEELRKSKNWWLSSDSDKSNDNKTTPFGNVLGL